MNWDQDTITYRRSIKSADLGFQQAMAAAHVWFDDAQDSETTSKEPHAVAPAQPAVGD